MEQASQPPPLSDAQLEIMNVVWDHGEATVAEIWQELSSRRGVARNTVQTLVTRLEEKGWLTHVVERNAFRYRAVLPRETTQRRLVRRLVDSAFGGSTQGLLLTLLEEGELSREEAAHIRAVIDRAERGA